jgi:hypothetical protein
VPSNADITSVFVVNSGVHMLSCNTIMLAVFPLYLCVCVRTIKDESVRKLSVPDCRLQLCGFKHSVL